MAIGIAGDNPVSPSSLTDISNTNLIQDLLTGILVELRTSNYMTITLQPYPPILIDNMRVDQLNSLAAGVE